jgi:hypothetical protein
MRTGLVWWLPAVLLGCGSDDSTAPDGFDAPGEEFVEAVTDDVAGADDAVPRDDAAAADDAPAADDAGADLIEVPGDDSGAEDAVEAADDGGGTCGPHWHPTACGDCGGTWIGDTCNQGCDPASCGDGREYLAECDGTTHTCRCLIDGFEVCSCTSVNPIDAMGCEPEEWGGANCCWNVG